VVAHAPTIPENLFESFVFGHRRGAFTDAKTDKKGLVTEAEGGTLLIDEISETPVSFQAKLLRFIETRKFLVPGESSERTADVRIVAATNRKIREAIEKQEFREDLYYRLNVLEIEIPPLRNRKEDIKALVLEKKEHLKGKKLSSGFWKVIYNYEWPGNIRELITVLKRVGIYLDNPVIGGEIAAIINQSYFRTSAKEREDEICQTWNDIKSGKNFWEVVKTPYLDREISRKDVRKIVERALAERGGKYCDILDILNLEPKEYKKFMNFLKVQYLSPLKPAIFF
jgi:transcriptional regulator with PAS, ATPase and Fis domain